VPFVGKGSSVKVAAVGDAGRGSNIYATFCYICGLFNDTVCGSDNWICV
jgi:hypothetical protein